MPKRSLTSVFQISLPWSASVPAQPISPCRKAATRVCALLALIAAGGIPLRAQQNSFTSGDGSLRISEDVPQAQPKPPTFEVADVVNQPWNNRQQIPGTPQPVKIVGSGAQGPAPMTPAAVPGDTKVTTDKGTQPLPPTKASLLSDEWKRLEALPPYKGAISTPAHQQALSSALRLLANAAGMNYMSPDDALFSEKITIHAFENPWHLIQSLEDKYNFRAEFDGSLWTFSRPSDNEIVVRTYQLRYFDLAKTKITPPNINTGLNTGSGSGMGGGSNNQSSSSSYSASSSNGTGVQGNSSTSMSNGGSIDVDTDQIVKKVEAILKMPVTGLSDIVAPEGQAAALREIPPPGYAMKVNKVAETTAAQSATNVVYIPNSNRLVVWAPRQLQDRVAQFLAAADRPQRQMMVRVVYFEVNRSRATQLGFDPTLTANLSTTISQTNTGPLNKLGSLFTTPVTNVVNTASLTQALQALQNDGAGHIKDSANLDCVNGENAHIDGGLSIPIINSTTSTASLATAQNTSSVQYINVGIQTDIFPRIVDDRDKGHEVIRLNLTIGVSAQAGSVNLNGQPYPELSTRTYALAVSVHNGETAAIGGLVESQVTTNDTGIPVLGGIPLIGWLFKGRDNTDSRSTLIAYITPYLDPGPQIEAEPVLAPEKSLVSTMTKHL